MGVLSTFFLRSTLVVGTTLLSTFALRADVIPAKNRTNWSAAGIEGASNPQAIPDTSTWTVIDVTTRGCVRDGVTDNLAAINAIISGLANPANTVLYFPAGTYHISGEITCTKSNVVVRGANSTTALNDRMSVLHLYNTTQSQSCVHFNQPSTFSSWLPLSSGYSQGSTSLVLADSGDASGINVGDCFYISQSNDPAMTYCPDTYEGAPENNGVPDARKLMAQFIRVTAKSGTALMVAPALYVTFSASGSPCIKKIVFTQNCGVENIALTRSGAGTNYQGDNGVFFTGCRNCWAFNVECWNHDGAGIKLNNCFGGIIRHCYIHDAGDTTSGHGYGRFIFGICSNILTEDNIFWKMRHDLLYEGGGSGCVDAYNYCDDTYSTDALGWIYGSIDMHGATPYCNLIEGNRTPKMTHDNSHGNAVFNTWFRDAGAIFRTGMTNNGGLAGVDFQYKSYGNAVVDCVVGLPGLRGVEFANDRYVDNTYASYRLGGYNPGHNKPWDANVSATTTIHLTYDYIGNKISENQSSGLDARAPASLYLSARPSWWNVYIDPATGAAPPWPNIGSELTPMVSKTPAQLRYEGAAGNTRDKNPEGSTLSEDTGRKFIQLMAEKRKQGKL